MSEDVVVSFKGFKPTETTASEVKVLTDALREESPSESSLNATFSKARGNKYEGFIRINFSEGSFIAKAKDYDLGSVIAKLGERLREQLGRWRNVRFDSTSEGGLSYGGQSH
jgi:hypothetical protein